MIYRGYGYNTQARSQSIIENSTNSFAIALSKTDQTLVLIKRSNPRQIIQVFSYKRGAGEVNLGAPDEEMYVMFRGIARWRILVSIIKRCIRTWYTVVS